MPWVPLVITLPRQVSATNFIFIPYLRFGSDSRPPCLGLLNLARLEKLTFCETFFSCKSPKQILCALIVQQLASILNDSAPSPMTLSCGSMVARILRVLWTTVWGLKSLGPRFSGQAVHLCYTAKQALDIFQMDQQTGLTSSHSFQCSSNLTCHGGGGLSIKVRDLEDC